MKREETKKNVSAFSAWSWIPSLYFAEGLPYVAVMTISVIMYKRLGLSNAEIAFYTSWLYLPWVIKPLWSPVVEIFSNCRVWIVLMQLLIGAAFASVALSLQTELFFKISLIFFWLLAFNSATHDIAADGFYILALDSHRQAYFVGVRSTFYRISMIVGQGVLVMLAGYIESAGDIKPLRIELNAEIISNASACVFNIPSEMPADDISSDIALKSFPSAKIAIPIAKISKDNFAELRQSIRKFNGTDEDKCKQGNAEKKSFWVKFIKEPIERFLTDKFGTNKRISSKSFTGNCAVAFIAVNRVKSFRDKIVMNLDFASGDKGIRLIEGARREFNSENWSRPQAVLFQLDPNIVENSSAVFIARSGDIRFAWTIVFAVLAVLFFFFCLYHIFALPSPVSDRFDKTFKVYDNFWRFIRPFYTFFRKENIIPALVFILLYRLGESQIVKLASPFLLDSLESGGIAMSTGELGFVYGTVGVILLTIGGILGGLATANGGLKRWIWIMALAINIPDLVYVYMAYFQPDNFVIVSTLIGVEQFGYGFGFAGYMLYMVYYATNSEYKTSHYAIMTGLMALGMMIPGMWSGWLQELIGYEKFFIWACLATIPGFIVIYFLEIDPEFGKRKI